MKPYFITTSIAYPNANPHIGYAMELVQADFLARYYRLSGQEVFFLTGNDDHGLKILRTAEKMEVKVEDFVAEKGQIFQKLGTQLGLTYNRFIRTTDSDHLEMAAALWRACEARGDIYKKQYQAWYNVKEEEFLGLVEDFPNPKSFGVDMRFVEKIDEENYFFALSHYKSQILELIKTGKYKISPESRLQEIINFVEQKDLQDISISREASKLPWGVPVPNDDTQVMYVWFDALTNYLTASCQVQEGKIIPGKLWPANLHLIGKDITRFHALIWSGMLLSAGLELPKELLVHGFVTSGGQKMSKSLGNVVDPFAMVEEFGQNALRWYLLKEIPTTGDGDFTLERFAQVTRADLANDYGNLISRVWTMVQKYNQGEVPNSVEGELKEQGERIGAEFTRLVEERQLHQALQMLQDCMAASNRQIDLEKPWQLIKEGKPEQVKGLLYQLLEVLRLVTLFLQPAIPEATDRVKQSLFPSLTEDEWAITPDNYQWGKLVEGTRIGGEAIILFPKSHD